MLFKVVVVEVDYVECSVRVVVRGFVGRVLYDFRGGYLEIRI